MVYLKGCLGTKDILHRTYSAGDARRNQHESLNIADGEKDSAIS